MPKFRRSFLQSVFYLFRRDAEGEFIGPLGTGVILCLEQNLFHPTRHFYAVTAQHVIKSGASNIRLNMQTDGSPTILATRPVLLDPHEWEFKEGDNDVAARDITDLWKKSDPFVSAIPTTDLATDVEIGRIGLTPGEDAFMVGLFVQNPGTQFNAPVTRFGNVAQLANNHHPVKQGNDVKRPSHIVDMHSRPGFSGSPVFAFRTPGNDLTAISQSGDYNLDLNEPNTAFVKLLGIHSGQFREVANFSRAGVQAESERAPILDGDSLSIQSSMTIVVPAQAILDLLYLPKFQELRAEREARLGAK